MQRLDNENTSKSEKWKRLCYLPLWSCFARWCDVKCTGHPAALPLGLWPGLFENGIRVSMNPKGDILMKIWSFFVFKCCIQVNAASVSTQKTKERIAIKSLFLQVSVFTPIVMYEGDLIKYFYPLICTFPHCPAAAITISVYSWRFTMSGLKDITDESFHRLFTSRSMKTLWLKLIVEGNVQKIVKC